MVTGSHDTVVDGNHDSKQLGSGLVQDLAAILHALAVVGVIIGPWGGVTLGVLVSIVCLFGRSTRATSIKRTLISAAIGALLLAVVIADPVGVSEVQRWLLD